MSHPLKQFKHCPSCGSEGFRERNFKAKECPACGFVYYFNPSASVACFIKNSKGELLVVRRAKDPAKGTLDLPGGFSDMGETAEEVVKREVKEETGLDIRHLKYLFSLPNIYPYMGFEVQTLDMIYECYVETFECAQAADDAAEILILQPRELKPEKFGLHSIRKAVSIYTDNFLKE